MVMPRPKGKALELANKVVPALHEKQNLVKAVYGVDNPLIEDVSMYEPPAQQEADMEPLDAF